MEGEAYFVWKCSEEKERCNDTALMYICTSDNGDFYQADKALEVVASGLGKYYLDRRRPLLYLNFRRSKLSREIILEGTSIMVRTTDERDPNDELSPDEQQRFTRTLVDVINAC